MSDNQHTPGPWRVNVDGCGDVFISGHNGEYVADIGAPDDDHAAADALLIAEAPCLLGALVSVLQAHDYDGALTTGNASLSPAIRSMVAHTIAKATGKEPA